MENRNDHQKFTITFKDGSTFTTFLVPSSDKRFLSIDCGFFGTREISADSARMLASRILEILEVPLNPTQR